MTNIDVSQAAATGVPEPPLGEASPESLDKVRDILFGGQMRAIESRLQAMEERLLRGQEAVRSDLGRHLAELTESLARETRGLDERLAAERARRTEELTALGTALREALRDLEARHIKLEKATGLADADLRDEVLGLSRALSTEIGRVNERLSAELARTTGELRAEKLDTSRLATALADLAASLRGDAVEEVGKVAAGG